jgi:hypothetical protein
MPYRLVGVVAESSVARHPPEGVVGQPALAAVVAVAPRLGPVVAGDEVLHRERQQLARLRNRDVSYVYLFHSLHKADYISLFD